MKNLSSTTDSEILDIVHLDIEELRDRVAKIVPITTEKILSLNTNFQVPCNADCKYCGWNRNEFNPEESRPRMTAEIFRRQVRDALRLGATLELLESCVRIRRKFLDFLENLEINLEGCGICPGITSPENLARMRQLGIQHLTNNLETSRDLFSRLVTSHEYEEKISTLLDARSQGMEIHSGILIGLGENENDRAKVLETLRSIDPDALDLNFFFPEPHLNFAKNYEIPAPEVALRALYEMRLVFPQKTIFLGGGQRKWLKELLPEAITIAGGEYVRRFLGRSVEGDERLPNDLNSEV